MEYGKRWHTRPNETDTVTVSDGIVTYYATFNMEVYHLEDIANDFADGYDHNGEPGAVNCVAQDIASGELFEFICEP